MVKVLGYDIGGANTKALFLHIENCEVFNADVAVEYFPIWKDPEKLTSVLLALKEKLTRGKLDAIGVTMTAELSDAYQTKREGVTQILSCVKKAFSNLPIFVLNTDAELLSPGSAQREPLSVAAANWAATGWLLAQYLKNIVVVDVGSTSTSIIPVVHGKVAANGKTDLDKLICGELVYTGSLRTNVAAIVQSIPLKDNVAKVSSELFALTGDVHLVLENIIEADYTSETADGRGKSIPEALSRLSRVICADTEMLNKQEILDMARYIYEQQIRQIVDGLTKVYMNTKEAASDNVSVVVTGLGKNFLARKAAEYLRVDNIIELDMLLPKQAVLATPAAGVALMTASKIKGESVKWTR